MTLKSIVYCVAQNADIKAWIVHTGLNTMKRRLCNMSSPLDPYRQSASFNWKNMKNLIEGEENVQFKNQIYEILRTDKEFSRNFERPTIAEHRELNHKRWKRLIEYGFVTDPYSDYERFMCLNEVLETYDQGLSARLGLHANVFSSAIASMGTARHNEILEQTKNNQIVGCFALTEIGHGSNTQEILTTATFDNGEFVFNTPSDLAVKCWVGNLAQSATHACVFAQMYVNKKCEGVHAFVLQIRDPVTYNTLPGIAIGDMGEKPGSWNGVENGWMEFKNHRAPLWTLLNKGCDVTPTGEYISSFKSNSDKQSISLGALSVGRVGIIGKGVLASGLASTIAIRYSAARRQFGPNKGEEIPVLEYPLQQHRLFPYLAGHFAMKIFHKKFLEYFTEYMVRVMQNERSEELAEFSKEVHALSSCAKPVATWFGVEALSEARRACGGHGFLYSSRLNDLRDSFDPSQTFEGENNMIMQQTSNILLAKMAKGGSMKTPMETMKFLEIEPKPFSGKWSERIVEDVLSAYKWMIYRLIKEISTEYKRLKATNNNLFQVKNQTQVHRAHTLSIAFAEHTIIQWCEDFIKEVTEPELKATLSRMSTLYALFALEKHLATLYIGSFCNGPEFGEGVRSSMREVEKALVPDAVALVDAIAPPDFILHSTLGMSDGRVYDHLLQEFRTLEGSRPAWWQDLSDFLGSRKTIQSKL